MPEGRMLKKRISDSKKLGLLKSDSARLLYTWLLPHLDVEGRHSADPELVKGHIFPKVKSMTIAKIQKLLIDLNEIKLIILYKNDGEEYLQLKKFHDFQKIDKTREAKSTIPSYTSVDSILTHDNSGVATENEHTIKVNESKVKVKLKYNESKVKLNGEANKLPSLCSESKIPNDIDIRLTQLLIDKILENNPKSHIAKSLTEKRQGAWIDACRKLREINGRSEEDIERIIIWCQQDDFWKPNILSMPTLRKKFDQLWLKAEKTKFSGIKDWYNKSEKENAI